MNEWMNEKNMISLQISQHFLCRMETRYAVQEENVNMELEDRVYLKLFSHCTLSEKNKKKKRLALKSDLLTELIG